MARVFVSYRRADGRMAVDWIAERLQTLDLVTGIQTAFHDGGLKAGDDFGEALIDELEACQLVIVVIGPNWEGRRDDGTARIKDPDDWVVKEIATAMDLGKQIMPVLIDDAPVPATADLHESINTLPGKHSLPFERGKDLDTLIEHVGAYLLKLDEEEATKVGLEKPIVVPDLLPWPRLVPLLVAGAVFGFVSAYLSAFGDVTRTIAESGLTEETAFTTTGGYSWYAYILVVYGVFGGIAAPVGVLISLRLMRKSTTRWREMIPAGLLVASVPALMIFSSGGGHLELSKNDLSYGELRAFGNLALIVLALAAWAYAVGAPIYATAKAGTHELGERVMQLAMLRDAERWGVIIAATILSIGTGVSVSIAAAVDQKAVDEQVFNATSVIAVPIVLSAVILVVHRWAVSAMAETHVKISAELDGLAEPYKSNGIGRMAAAPFADGGLAFRFIMSMPAIVAIVGVVIYEASSSSIDVVTWLSVITP